MRLEKPGKWGQPRWVKLQKPGWNVATLGSLLMILIHSLLWELSRRGVDVSAVYFEWGGLSWEGLTQGRIWLLVSHLWLHGNWLHLAINVFLFYYAAAKLSHFMSGARITGLFLLCGIGSGLAHILVQAVFPGVPGLIGASGGITGLLLGYFSVSPQSRMLLFHVSASNLAKGVLIASGLLFILSPMLDLPLLSNLGRVMERAFGPGIFQAAHLVHLVGGLMGWGLITRFLPRLLNQDDLARMRMEQEMRGALR